MNTRGRRGNRVECACLAAGVAALSACASPAQDDLWRPEERELRSPAAHVAESAPSGPAARAGAFGASVPLAADDAADRPSAMAAAIASMGADDVPEESGALPRAIPAEESYLIPAVEIVAFQVLLNAYDRRYVDHDIYGTNRTSIRRNLHRGWVVDDDPFRMNQFAHPYTGSLYHGFARSAGLGYWEALVYDFAGSALWEVAGETEPPSLNDQISTSFAGSFLGEALYRLAELVLGPGPERDEAGRIALATVISPSAAVNRYAFGDRFAAPFPDGDPATFWSVGVGVGRNARLRDLEGREGAQRDHLVATVSAEYGLPGKPGYRYDRPFDYFHFEFTPTSSSDAIPESVVARGLLLGAPYESGTDLQGVWGLYGTYDYYSPELFKVSSTGLGVGTTAQVLLSDDVALQGTALVGGGYTMAGTTSRARRDREFRYSAGPQALLSLRLLLGKTAALELSANDFVIEGRSGASGASGRENIVRAQFGVTVRVWGPHAIGVRFVDTRRDPHFSGFPDPRQSVGALSVFYTYVSEEDFGVVRPGED